MSNYTKRLFLLLFAALGIFLVSVLSIDADNKQFITIGSKIETESVILAEILRIMIEKQTNLTVHHAMNLEGTLVCFNALRSKSIDLYIEYTGSALSAILKADLDQDAGFIRKELARRYDMVWLEALGFESSYALFTKNPRFKTFSQLKDRAVRLGVDPEFSARSECQKLVNAYAPNYEIMDQDLLFLSTYDVILAATTDPRTLGFYRLTDVDKLFPAYQATPLVRRDVLERHPELEKVLVSCKDFIFQDEICKLIIEVDLNHKNPYDVALDYLKSKGFL